LANARKSHFHRSMKFRDRLVDLCGRTKGTIFATVPTQNIDRMINLSQAAVQTERKFVIDIYSAELFSRLKSFSSDIPQPEMPHVLMWYPWIQRENLAKHGLAWVMKKHRQSWKKTLSEISDHIPNSIFLIRPPFRKEVQRHSDLTGSIWIYSMWLGYLKRSEPLRKLQQWADENGIPFEFLHTSGHAKLSDLKKLADAISPEMLIPIHSFHTDRFSQHFRNVRLIQDNETIEI
jgi:ribonuclease J